MRCPCRCSDPIRNQHKVDREKLIAAGLTGDWLSDARMCGYCGCVYSNEWDRGGRRYARTQRGKFVGDLIQWDRWEPVDPRNAKVEYSR